ncbi:hypothetical protein H696_04244 [Fonticula alba]|uniref:Uncharacterized protein n=1 Tax=Fonticula alba TaxID=691883 RepID=A0A058Z5M5_FONAL|nr:hypothetical protein H696_04244 [Fonticula alba]KCV68827.1 hypothetical protein H696_04244 [Fonticula alba]|eukprot:XP_009496398.1 hypothetical protein H696_04244 [Fonticula alba]
MAGFSSIVYRGGSPRFLGISVARFIDWMPTFAIWGVTLTVGGSFFLEPIPIFRRDVLANIPILGAKYAVMASEESE